MIQLSNKRPPKLASAAGNTEIPFCKGNRARLTNLHMATGIGESVSTRDRI